MLRTERQATPEGKAYERTKAEKKTHNFGRALPIHLVEQADAAIKSRYNLEFLGLDRPQLVTILGR